jgi:hypothetical protein
VKDHYMEVIELSVILTLLLNLSFSYTPYHYSVDVLSFRKSAVLNLTVANNLQLALTLWASHKLIIVSYKPMVQLTSFCLTWRT